MKGGVGAKTSDGTSPDQLKHRRERPCRITRSEIDFCAGLSGNEPETVSAYLTNCAAGLREMRQRHQASSGRYRIARHKRNPRRHVDQFASALIEEDPGALALDHRCRRTDAYADECQGHHGNYDPHRDRASRDWTPPARTHHVPPKS